MEEDNEKVFEDAKRNVKEQAYFMRKAIDESTLRTALKHAANMVGELRTNFLAPRDYYVLFMQIFDELRLLEGAFKEEYRRGRKMKDLYESVQHAGFVLPRIYLLITVGSVYIQTRDVSSKSILSDLMEMLKGVQHPLKGLFVRYYLLKMVKDKLPDTGSEYEGDGGDITDAVAFIIENLKEMNKLWIRVQTQGGKDKLKKEQERQAVKVTIGENLVRLSALNGCTLEIYQNTVLDSILQIITGTKDAMSQQYLMDCIIQAFPDEYHLHSLEKLLQTCGHMMQNNVDVKTIFIRLMDRLSQFAQNNEEVEEIKNQVDIFNLFKKNIDRIIEEQALQIELSKFLELQVAFLKFISQCYPGNIDYVNQILSACCSLCSKRSSTEINDESQKSIVSLLTLPLESLSITVLSLFDYPKLMKFLPFKKRKIVAQNIARAVAISSINLRDLKIVNQLIDFLVPILKDDPENHDSDATEFAAEQTLVARIVHLAVHNDANEYFAMLNRFKEVFLQGGEKRMAFTIPALFYSYIKLADFVYTSQNDKSEEQYDPSTAPANYKVFNKRFKPFRGQLTFDLVGIYHICREILQKFALHQPAICLSLNLSLILSINELIPGQQLDEFTYDICTDILQIYQGEIADADAKISALTEITAAFQRLTCLSEENFDTLISNTTQYSAKLLKKSDQCLAILKCSHLFYCPALKNQNRVMECFKKVLKLAEVVNSSQPTNRNIGLYVAILNKFIYFLEHDSFDAIRGEDVLTCVQMIKEKSAALASQPDAKWLQTYFNNTLKLIQNKKLSNPRFQSVFP